MKTKINVVHLTFITTTIILITTLLTQTIAQEPTPTDVPSKTPGAQVTQTTPEPTQEQRETQPPQISTPDFIAYTQDDLTVLTGNVQRPNGITWHDGNLYAICNGDWTIYEINAESGSTITYIFGIRNAHTSYIENINSTEIELWVPDFDTNTLFRVNRNRAPIPIATNLDGPWGIAYFDSDHFLVTNLLTNTVSRVNRNGQNTTVISGLRAPTGIVVDDEYIYIANNGSARRAIEWIERDAVETGETNITPQPLVSGLQNTSNLVMAADNYLYFTYSLGTRGVVGRINPEECRDTGCTHDQIEIVVYTELAAPLAGLTISPDMRLFVHSIFRPEIYWVDLVSNTQN